MHIDFIKNLYKRFTRERKTNPYLRYVKPAMLTDDKQVQLSFREAEINLHTKNLIESAEDEVLIQFYKYDSEATGGEGIKQALINLNEKARSSDKIIEIKVLVNERKGPAKWLRSPYKPAFQWIKHNDNGIFVEHDNNKHYLEHLKIETKFHSHYLFNSYHTKQIIVDKNKIMLRTGDVESDKNDPTNEKVDTATLIYNQDIATKAAKSFLARFKKRGSSIRKFDSPSIPTEDETTKPNMLLLEKNPSTDQLKRFFFNSPLKIAMLEAIKNTTTSIQIASPNLNDPDIVQALSASATRGIVISIVLPKFHNQRDENKLGMGGSNLKTITKLYDHIPVENWDNLKLRWAADQNGELIPDKSSKRMHAKLAIFDDVITITGSSPLDIQATNFSSESDVIFSSQTIAAKFKEKIFTPIYNQGIDNNAAVLQKLKEKLITEIKNYKLVSNKFFFRISEYKKLTNDKQNRIDQLIAEISNCGSFAAIAKTLKQAAETNNKNILAANRTSLFSNRIHYGETTTTKKLGRIYTKYF